MAATVSWHVMQRVAPGGGNPNIVATVATFSNQVLTPWESVALWSGLAVVAGELTRARGRWTGTALAAAAALLAVYAPAAAIVAGTAFAAAWLTERRWVIVAAGVAMVAFAWLAWVFDWRPGWGISNGPELTLWATVLAGAVVAGAGRPEAQGSQ